MIGAGKIHVEVACAFAGSQVVLALSVDVGTTLFDAVIMSRIAERFPDEIDLENSVMGVFSSIEPAPKTRVLREGDRVELYRPLLADPKDMRRLRAQKTKVPRRRKKQAR